MTTEDKKNNEGSPNPVKGRHLWLFRAIAITVIPVLLFLFLELALRVIGYGFPAAATIKYKINGKEAYCDNNKFGWRFFPPNIARDFDPFIFPAEKSDNTCRIFVLGSSAAKGTPDSAFCFGRMLQTMLKQQYPKVNFEVITPATVAINSHAILEIAKDCARHQPDLFVAYLGNNEVVGPYGAGTLFAPLSSNISIIRFDIAFKATKIGQMITNLAGPLNTNKDLPRVWHGMKMPLKKRVRADDRRLQIVYGHFQRNLEDIYSAAFNSGAKVISCTVGSNLKDSPPFASLHRTDLTDAEKTKWDTIYQEGIALETAGKYQEAIEKYLAAAEIDSSYADLQFRLGRCYWNMAEYEKAKDSYVKARQQDTLRYRPDIQINEVIRKVAGNMPAEDFCLVDAAKIFEENSPHGITGEELLYEHVHLNFKGNYLLAKTVFEQTEELLPDWVKKQKAANQPLLTEVECAQYLAYTDWDRYNIADTIVNVFMRNSPFTEQLYHDKQVREMEQALESLKKTCFTPEALEKSAAQYRWAIEKNPTDWWLHWKYGQLLSGGLGNYRAAVEQYSFVKNHLPHSYVGYAAMGRTLDRIGDLNGCIACLLEAVRTKPNDAELNRNLAMVYEKLGVLDKAIEYYSNALELNPYDAKTCNNLGASFCLQGKTDKAIETFREGLLFEPDNPHLRYNLAILLEMQGHKDEAIKELKAALQADPNSLEIRKKLETLSNLNNEDNKHSKTEEYLSK